MDDTMQTCRTKINQTTQNVQSIDQSINDMQKKMIQERNLSENFEQQKRDLMMKLNRLQIERESIHSSFKQLNQSKEFSKEKN
jgi:hypothetical protein